jgi:hypothetical protein
MHVFMPVKIYTLVLFYLVNITLGFLVNFLGVGLGNHIYSNLTPAKVPPNFRRTEIEVAIWEWVYATPQQMDTLPLAHCPPCCQMPP